jgi:cell division protein FtsL
MSAIFYLTLAMACTVVSIVVISIKRRFFDIEPGAELYRRKAL